MRNTPNTNLIEKIMQNGTFIHNQKLSEEKLIFIERLYTRSGIAIAVNNGKNIQDGYRLLAKKSQLNSVDAIKYLQKTAPELLTFHLKAQTTAN